EIVVDLLDVLAVVAFLVGQAEQPLFQDGVVPVPQRERQAQELPVIGKAGEAVLAPAVGAAARLVVGEIVPCRAVGAVVLAHRAPLPLTEIWAPATPILRAGAAFFDASLFGFVDLRHGLSAPVWRCVSPIQVCLDCTACVSKRHASSVQATDQACAGAPRGWCGASPSKISPMVPIPWSSRASLIASSTARAAVASLLTRYAARQNGPSNQPQTGPW